MIKDMNSDKNNNKKFSKYKNKYTLNEIVLNFNLLIFSFNFTII